MRIAFDITPLNTADKYRGIGSYTKILADNLPKYDKANQYFLITNKKVSSVFDILFIPNFQLFKISLPIVKKSKIILTMHDLIPIKYARHFPVGIKGNIAFQMQKILLNNIDLIITDSNASKTDILKIINVNADKVEVIYPGVSDVFRKKTDEENLIIKNKYNLPDDFLLYVGDCNWSKNIPALIKAANSLNRKLVLVGKVFTQGNIDFEHPWNQSIMEVHKLCQNRKNIIKLGFIPEQDLVSVYNLANLYIQPSIDEGFGYSIIEAMKCGCPVLSSNGGSLKEIGGDAPVYFDPLNVDQLTVLINKPITGTMRRNIINKGFKQSGKFSLISMIDKLQNVYKKVI